MHYLVVETFKNGPGPVYERAARRGRMLPEGLVHLDSWIKEPGLSRCFQLMETDDPALLGDWMANWNDLVDFEVVPVIGSREAARRALG